MKRIVIYSLGLLTVLLVALLLAPLFINVNDYKDKIAHEIEDATGRHVEIGAIKASLFPWVGVRLDRVSIANRLGFSGNDFIRVNSLDVQVALLPLLDSRIEVKQFQLDSPDIFLERNVSGEGNWEDLTRQSAATEVDTSSQANKNTAPAFSALQAELLQIQHGHFVWQDAMTNQRMELSDVELDVQDLQLERPVAFRLGANIGADRLLIDGQAGPIGDLAKLDINHLPVQVQVKTDGLSLSPFAAWMPELPEILGPAAEAVLQCAVTIEQRPDGKRLSVGSLAVSTRLPVGLSWKVEMPDSSKLELKNVDLALDGKDMLAAQGELSFGKKLAYQLRLKSQDIERLWLAKFVPELQSMYAAHSAPWQNFSLGALLSGTEREVDLRDLQLRLDGELLQASGVVNLAGGPDIRLRLAGKTLHVDPWLPQAEKQPAAVNEAEAGTAPKEPVREPDLRFLKPWRVYAQLQLEDMLLKGLSFQNLRMTLNGEKGLFRMEPLRFDLSGGQVSENASLNAAAYPAQWSESVNVSNVKLGPVLKAVADMDMLEGTLQMQTDLKARGLLPETSMKTLNGKGRLMLGDGSIKGFDIAGTLRNLASLGTANIAQQTDFSQMDGSFVVQNGVVNNQDLFMASPLFRLTGQGTVDLPQQTLDYHVKPKLVGTLVGQGDTQAVRNGLAIPLHISGALASPKVVPEIDPETLIQGVIGASKGAKPADIIQSILGGGKPQQPAQPETPAKPVTPEEKIQKTLKGLIPGF